MPYTRPVRTQLALWLQSQGVQARVRVLAEVMGHSHQLPLLVEHPAAAAASL